MTTLTLQTWNDEIVFSIKISNQRYSTERLTRNTILDTFIDIQHYSDLLLLQSHDKRIKIVKVFAELQRINDWFWEKHFGEEHNDGSKKDEIIKIVRKKLNKVSNEFNLKFIEL